ncbi:Tyrosine recombinase XerC [subsurface metagenome]
MMKVVKAIQSKSTIQAIKGIITEEPKMANTSRNILLWTMGTNLGLRISDLLALKLKDVQDSKGNIRESLEITEVKTKRPRDINIRPPVRKALQSFIKATDIYDLNEYLFKDRRKGRDDVNKPITRVRAWQMINEWGRKAGVTHRIGTHTLRKTFGKFAHKAGIPLIYISEELGHRNIEVTKRYLGITVDETKNAFKDFAV